MAVIMLVAGGLFAVKAYIDNNRLEIPQFDKLRNNMNQSAVTLIMGEPDDTDYTSSQDSVFGYGFTTFTYEYRIGKYTEQAHLSFTTKNGTLGYAAIDLSGNYYFDDDQFSEEDIKRLEKYKQEVIDYFTERLGTPSTEYETDYEEKTVYKWTADDGSTVELRVENQYDYDFLELWWNPRFEYDLYY